MMWFLLAAHVGGICAAAAAGRRSMRAALLTAALAPAATTVWAITALARDTAPTTIEQSWVEGLDLTLRFHSDSLALLLTVLVSGIGTLIFIYAAGYFAPRADAATRFPPSLLAFSTAMLGLVWADSIWTLFIFWELTSVTSFLLVGHKHTDAAVRLAARRALMITGGGGLVLLAGMLVLADAAGTTTISALTPVTGTTATLAAVLLLIAAATKSAQVPFHVWLPGAMAAPTPVSAYLHSATMVKAGIILMAVTGPAFADIAVWKTGGIAFGAVSMIWGGLVALRHLDAKLILAWGTISQLGLIVMMLAVGSGKAVFAAISLLFAHALFKAALFMVIGEVDVRTGTRSIDELGGLWRTMPVSFAIALLAGISMAGAPPLLGFTAKEAAIEAALKLDGFEQVVVLATVIGGSVLTVAYTARLLLGVFGPGPATTPSAARPLMTSSIVVLGSMSLAGYVALGVVNDIVGPAATELNAASGEYSLIAWPGLKTAFLISIGIVVVGAALGVTLARRQAQAPGTVGANMADHTLDTVIDRSPQFIARVQHGSLPIYLATMATVAAAASIPLITDLSTTNLTRWDSKLQALLAAATIAAAIAGAMVGSRLGAALALGAVGLGVSGLFVVHGAPDLALTQLLVETVIVVGFVIGLGHLGRQFPPVQHAWRAARVVVSVGAGAAVALALASASGDPVGEAPIERLTEASVDEAGGTNVVNVILTDLRALDTLGEVVVLATVAVGLLALARTRSNAEAAS